MCPSSPQGMENQKNQKNMPKQKQKQKHSTPLLVLVQDGRVVKYPVLE
jgi:hypothetical protein